MAAAASAVSASSLEVPQPSAAAGEKRLLELASLPAEQVLARLGCSAERGLSAEEAARRLERWGPNEIRPSRREGLLWDLLHRVKN
ncbi:MAG: hypothetical protein KGK30_05705, partial [Elusimicrobia bacterium]|nr:hypothetical protein [Elusimicrobiota bacterium]